MVSLECTDDIKLTAPQNNFELSAFTNKDSKFFDDLAISCGEVTDRIDINFSTVKQIGDDLDEIQKDLNQHFSHAPINRQNMYIEVDLNNEDNMSIINTVHSPKVQDIFKNNFNTEKDWVVDKENIATNPYAIPRETDNFAVIEKEVLVFDGKRLTIQSEKANKENYRQTLLPDASEKAPPRITMVPNVYDNLPNFIDNPMSNSGFIGIAETKKSIILDHMSTTEILDVNNQRTKNEEERTILYEDGLGNISVTQAIPSNIVTKHNKKDKLYADNTGNISVTQADASNIAEKRRTIIFDNDDCDISITQALPTYVQENKINVQQNDKRRTILYDDRDISMTQALPANIHAEKTAKRWTAVYEDHAGNLSITQAVPNKRITESKPEKLRTIVFEHDTGNISLTEAIPLNMIVGEYTTDRTAVFESDTGNICVTQAVPSNETPLQKYTDNSISETKMVPTQILNSNSRRTIVYENDTGNLSITQAVRNQVIQGITTQHDILHDDDETTNKRSIVFHDDISTRQAVSVNQVNGVLQHKQKLEGNTLTNESQLKHDVCTNNNATNRRRTVVFDDADADISMTQAVPMNIIHNCNPFNEDNSFNPSIKTEATNKRQTVVFENNEADISMTQSVNINHFEQEYLQQNAHDDLEAVLKEALHNTHGRKKQLTIVYDKETTSISKSHNHEAIDKNISISQRLRDSVIENAVKQTTIVFEGNTTSMTQALPVNIAEKTFIKNIDYSQSKDTNDSILDVSMEDIRVEEIDNISMTQALPVNIAEITDMKNIEYSQSKDPNGSILDVSMEDIRVEEKDVSTTQAKYQAEKVIRKSFNSKPYPANLVTKEIPSNFLKVQFECETKSEVKDISKNPNIMESSTKSVHEVLVYQTALTRGTEGDAKSEERIVIENYEKLSSTSKTDDDIKVKESIESTNKGKQTDKITEQNQLQKLSSEINDDQASIDTTRQHLKSFLNDLLDMSDGIDDKGLMAQVVKPIKETCSESSTKESKLSIENLTDTLFFITKDTGDDAQIQTDKCEINNVPLLTDRSPLSLEYKDEAEMVEVLQNKPENLKDAFTQIDTNSSRNRQYVSIVRTDFNKDIDKSKVQELNMSKGSRSFKTANDTNELFEMLTDLTDKTTTRNVGKAHSEENDQKPKSILIKRHLGLENKSEADSEPRRLSFATRCQSTMICREDLLNNISMAGAALKSRIDFDESDLDDSVNTPQSHKSARLSSEVVKTLHFDESISETTDTDKKPTLLKKTAFGETSYMHEHKAKVIPNYLKDVSDGIKELMDDLVKPNADILPLEEAGINKNSLRKKLSNRSTRVQANLITPSQIDIPSELCSNQDSVYDMSTNRISSVDMVYDPVNTSVSQMVKSSNATHSLHKSFNSKICDSATEMIIPARPTEQPPKRLLVFDQTNPFNNILIAPEIYTDVHTYNPGCSEESNPVQILLNVKDKECEDDKVSTQYNVGSVLHSFQQSGDASMVKVAESMVPNLSKPILVDQSTVVKLTESKDTGMNTLIVMKENNELMKVISSLTLVDDALARCTFDVDIDSRATSSQEEMTLSPVQVIYPAERVLSAEQLDTDSTYNEKLDRKKSKKRCYNSPKQDKTNKLCTVSSLDITPNPISKTQKLAKGLKCYKANVFRPAEEPPETDSGIEQKRVQKKTLRKPKNKKPGTSITVQQLMTEYKVGPIDHEILDDQIKGVLRDPKSDNSCLELPQLASQSDLSDCTCLDMTNSFTSSKRYDSEVMSPHSSKISRTDWQTDLMHDTNSKYLVTASESSVNIVAKIDMMPFMG